MLRPLAVLAILSYGIAGLAIPVCLRCVPSALASRPLLRTSSLYNAAIKAASKQEPGQESALAQDLESLCPRIHPAQQRLAGS